MDSTASQSDVRPPSKALLRFIPIGVAAIVFGILAIAFSPLKAALAVAVMAVFMRIGIAALRGLAQPPPEPPPAGELRKVKLSYRCSLCGTEVKMTVADAQNPDPPRHCMEDMDLVATGDL